MKRFTPLLFLIFSSVFHIQAQELYVYELQSAYTNIDQEETTGFISLSDNYPLNKHPDSLAVPDSLLVNGNRYLELKGKYRTQLLDKTNIKEDDHVYIYDYVNKHTYIFKVNDLKTVAILTPYDLVGGRKKSQYDYMLGFEIDQNVITTEKSFLDDYFVSIGKTNSFLEANLHPIIWEPVDSTCFPTGFDTPSLLQRTKQTYRRGKTFEYIKGNLGYYTQDIFSHDNNLWGRHVIVIDIYTYEIILNHFYYNSEGTSVAPLNNTEGYDDITFQWTGQLLNGQSPILFGFTHQSFGCIQLHLIKQPKEYIRLCCDNRH